MTRSSVQPPQKRPDPGRYAKAKGDVSGTVPSLAIC
jgi:hypothetical protein